MEGCGGKWRRQVPDRARRRQGATSPSKPRNRVNRAPGQPERADAHPDTSGRPFRGTGSTFKGGSLLARQFIVIVDACKFLEEGLFIRTRQEVQAGGGCGEHSRSKRQEHKECAGSHVKSCQWGD